MIPSSCRTFVACAAGSTTIYPSDAACRSKHTFWLAALLASALIIGCGFVSSATAQSINPQPPAAALAPSPQTNSVEAPIKGGDDGGRPFDVSRILTRFEFWLSGLVLIFGLVVIVVEALLLRRRDFTSSDIQRIFCVTLIIIGTLVLIPAGFGDKQIAPAMGLFGTLAGWLLGRSDQKGGNSQSLDKKVE